MKIPFLPLHIVKSQTIEDLENIINAMNLLGRDDVPTIQQLIDLLYIAKSGRSASGRRKVRRQIQRKLGEIKGAA